VDLVIDRFEYAGQCGEMIEMSDLTRSIARKPQDIHEAVRTLIHDGVVAIVSPNRGSPGMGKVWFDSYRYSKLKLTDVTCDWEETWCEREVQVSEPLGEVVPECFGQERVGQPKPPRVRGAPQPKMRTRRLERNLA
jgi:hypothetical protein